MEDLNKETPTTEGEESLGDAGKRALAAERQKAKEEARKAKELQEKLDALQKQQEEQTKKFKELEEKAKQYEGLDPEELEKLQKEREQREEEEKAYRERFETERQKREALQQQLEESRKSISKLESEYKEAQLQNRIRNDWVANGGDSDDLAFRNLIYPLIRQNIKPNEDDPTTYYVVDSETGSPKYSKLDTNQLMGMDELMDTLPKQYPSLEKFISTQTYGGGVAGQSGTKRRKFQSLWEANPHLSPPPSKRKNR